MMLILLFKYVEFLDMTNLLNILFSMFNLYYRNRIKLMTIQEQVTYWIEMAEQDMPVAESLFKNGHFMWCLYIGHLILEKL
jgi:hypothetical protein